MAHVPRVPRALVEALAMMISYGLAEIAMRMLPKYYAEVPNCSRGIQSHAGDAAQMMPHQRL